MTPPDFDHIAAPVAWWAARRPDHPALIDATLVWTYAELEAAITASCKTLISLGIRPGDRVALIGDNSAVLIALMLGASRAGAWIVPLNPRLSEPEIDDISRHATPRRTLIVTTTPASRAHAERLGATPCFIASLTNIAITAEQPEATPEPDTTIAALIYTSGTTGQPKGVMLAHRNLTISARTSGRIRALGPADRVWSVLPISHSLGFTGVMLGSFTFGATLILAPRFDPARAIRAILDQAITVIIGAPSMFALIAEYAARQKCSPLPPHALRLIASAGAPLDDAVKHSVETCFCMTLNNGYGITECAPTIAQTRIDRPRTDCAVGMILPGLKARLHNEANGIGALHISGPVVMKGYYRNPSATDAVLDPDGWFDTGDLATFRDDHLFIVGRSKEQITRFGFKIYPAEVEAVLNAHPDVRLSAVIGQGADGLQNVIAYIEPTTPDIDLAGLTRHTILHLADYKRPTEFRVMTPLPMGATGKVLKSSLGLGEKARPGGSAPWTPAGALGPRPR